MALPRTNLFSHSEQKPVESNEITQLLTNYQTVQKEFDLAVKNDMDRFTAFLNSEATQQFYDLYNHFDEAMQNNDDSSDSDNEFNKYPEEFSDNFLKELKVCAQTFDTYINKIFVDQKRIKKTLVKACA